MLLLITPPIQVKDEATILRQIALFDTCIIHVRKPNFSIEQMKKWLEQFPSEATQKMMLHQHHQLQNEFNLKGIHFKESHKNSGVPFLKDTRLIHSAAYHNVQDAIKQDHYHYSMLSPVFDSISKSNLKGKHFQIQKSNKPIIALGGIGEQNLKTACDLGFQGIAVLGSVWQHADPVKAFKTIEKKYQNVFR